jgi:hypothetical protein
MPTSSMPPLAVLSHPTEASPAGQSRSPTTAAMPPAPTNDHMRTTPTPATTSTPAGPRTPRSSPAATANAITAGTRPIRNEDTRPLAAASHRCLERTGSTASATSHKEGIATAVAVTMRNQMKTVDSSMAVLGMKGGG